MWWVIFSQQIPIFEQRYGSSSMNVPPKAYRTHEGGKVIEVHPLIWQTQKENQGYQLIDWKELSEADITAYRGVKSESDQG